MSLLDRIGATRPGVWVIGHVVSPAQRRLLLATGGRVSLTGLPILLLTVTGRRSGRRRTIPLIFLRDGDDLVVCNVRPASERPNPWPLNVRANPNVSVRIRGATEQRVAREAGAKEVAKYWPLLVKLWPAYERFFADTHERSIFVLERKAARSARAAHSRYNALTGPRSQLCARGGACVPPLTPPASVSSGQHRFAEPYGLNQPSGPRLRPSPMRGA